MRRDSHRTDELVAALRRLGEDVTPRQLERLGEFGLLGPATDEVSPALIERAKEAVTLVHAHRSRADAALVMFVQGHEFDKARLEHAYLTALERAEEWIESHAGSVGGEMTAGRMARKFADKGSRAADQRPIRERLKQMRTGRRFVTVKQSLESLYTDAVLILTDGHASSDQGLRELLQAIGADALARDSLPGRPPPVTLLPIEPLKTLFRQIRLASQAANISRASYQQLQAARDDTNTLLSFARIFAPAAQRAFGLGEAFGFTAVAGLTELAAAFVIPIMVVVRAAKAEDLDHLKAIIDLNRARFEAINDLLDAIPPRFYPISRIEKMVANNELPLADRAELEAAVDKFEAEHPDRWTLIVSDIKPLPRVKYG